MRWMLSDRHPISGHGLHNANWGPTIANEIAHPVPHATNVILGDPVSHNLAPITTAAQLGQSLALEFVFFFLNSDCFFFYFFFFFLPFLVWRLSHFFGG